MAKPDEVPGQSVLDLLAPHRAAYVRRVVGPSQSTARHHRASGHIVSEPYAPCSIEAVVTVDPKGRVPWPRGVQSSEAATLKLGAGLMIEVTFGEATSSRTRLIDRRGRLQLPLGLMRAAGIRTGDRVAIIRRADRDAFGVAPAGSLGVRQGAA